MSSWKDVRDESLESPESAQHLFGCWSQTQANNTLGDTWPASTGGDGGGGIRWTVTAQRRQIREETAADDDARAKRADLNMVVVEGNTVPPPPPLPLTSTDGHEQLKQHME